MKKLSIILTSLLLLPIMPILCVAAPQIATVTFRGAKRTYHKELYCSDVDTGRTNWDAGDGAGSSSPEYFIPPVPMALIDISILTGMTDTTKMQLTVGGAVTGDYFTFANHLNTLPERVPISIPIPAGLQVTFIQRA